MDDAVRVRDAAHEAIDDVEPDRLREVLSDRLSDAPMTPAVLALVSARAPDTGVETDTDGLIERAAGVQLIYEGLRLTRSLAREEPWTRLADGDAAGDTAERGSAGSRTKSDDNGTPKESRAAGKAGDIDADLDVIAADILVSRGFYLLARTDAAARAVDVVRAFGRDQTLGRRDGADVEALDRNLEADVFALAVVAGMTAVGATPSPALLEYAAELGRDCDADGRLQPADAAFSEKTAERIASLSAVGGGANDRVPSSATDS
ncbi:DUF7114 family protein [Halobellus sp. GM3]|uniref:DUF7114 family protein n=1 Tax=Halobellus sp. GM3 TaxID=3458410 RepID=UPI00403DDFF1